MAHPPAVRRKIMELVMTMEREGYTRSDQAEAVAGTFYSEVQSLHSAKDRGMGPTESDFRSFGL